ncbi:glutathione peroxidase [Staphylococcus sp. SQ8-PEA]|uniref:Glutathione peroxidase n=2 Tax=Staphylococcus marylandisciuri TaxID=2981529 RepID=A0ABT2QT02_9STAP|nr:glutathione peroxidase [Staphylococcus marylandisciuri]
MSIYDIEVEKNSGDKYHLSEYQNEVMLIVNTASECGFTPQFEGLQSLYQEFKSQGFTVLGFPCNQFGGQEPGNGEEAKQYCQINYGVSFPMHEKIEVKGENQHPLYRYLTHAQHGLFNEKIKWNFTKFLVDRKGNVVKRFGPQKDPKHIRKDIKELL